ncbi:exodeoxyribonuclease VII small subunit [Arthrobacter sp. H14-L1]|uniref:exodeoxyribonuclease VII small subunit n=1 Tax=Arthrobacter sp. H14-L1 TaxID=2996697 RepID=UPI00226F0BC7|nr:exodeoxyribonuclease VII small subunit [Arthrobacter sp. H14-L1]MCY0903418.1 exodeoxyribonuclease VII small subunit [Arthrobacter sp. H14-L1]
MSTNPNSQAAPALNTDVAALSYEQAREQLVSVVSQLEAGGASLEESLGLWERGEALAKKCEEWLEGAKARLARDASGSGTSGEVQS